MMRPAIETRLDSIADVRLGRQRTPGKHNGPNMRPYLRTANISRHGLALHDVKKMHFDEREMETFRLEAGDILVGEASGSLAEVGKSAIWQDEIPDCAFQNTLMRVRSRNIESADPRYLLHFLQHQFESGTMASMSKGVGIRHLGREALAALRVPIHPIDAQRRIVQILDLIDRLRTARREAIALLDNLAQSIFLDMFGTPESDWPTVTVEAAAGRAKGSIRTGPFGSQLLHSEFVNAGIPVLGIDNAVHNEFRWGERRYITKEKYAQLSRYTVHPGDVLITIMGTCGRCAIVPANIPTAINTKHLCCITLDQEKCLPEYLQAYFLIHQVARSYLRRAAKGAIMSGLNMEVIKNLPITLPPLVLQREFTDKLRRLTKLREAHQASRAELEALFASVQHLAFRGELFADGSLAPALFSR